MSRNYDNWERLVAAVVKREQIWQLCHQDSVSTINSDYSSQLEFSLPISLSTTDTFEFIRPLKEDNDGSTYLVRLEQDVQVWDHQYIAKGTIAVIKWPANAWKMTGDEFEQLMGKCMHENVVTPWGYRFSETTKLMVYDYYEEGSVFDMLHGKILTRPDWESRVRIAVGTARGIAHVHNQHGGKLAHGNIKSSNIFLNSQGYGCIFNNGSVSDIGSLGHKPDQKSDVYSFGRVLIELVTRERPMDVYLHEWNDSNGSVEYIQSIEPDQWNIDYFKSRMIFPQVDELDRLWNKKIISEDTELQGSAAPEEVRRMLGVAKKCLSLLAEERPSMPQVVLELENILRHPHPPPPPPRHSHRHRGVEKAAWHKFLRFPRWKN